MEKMSIFNQYFIDFYSLVKPHIKTINRNLLDDFSDVFKVSIITLSIHGPCLHFVFHLLSKNVDVVRHPFPWKYWMLLEVVKIYVPLKKITLDGMDDLCTRFQ